MHLQSKACLSIFFYLAGSSDDLETDYRNWDPSGVAVAAAERERRSMLGPSHPIPLTALQEDDVLAEVEQTYFKSGRCSSY